VGQREHQQLGFAGGELSPLLHVDSEVYRKALVLSSNTEHPRQGSVRLRGGSVFQANVGMDPRARLVPLRVSSGQDYVLVLTDLLMQIYSVGGQVGLPNGGSVGQVEELLNYDFSSGLANWTQTGAVVYIAGRGVQLQGQGSAISQVFAWPANAGSATIQWTCEAWGRVQIYDNGNPSNVFFDLSFTGGRQTWGPYVLPAIPVGTNVCVKMTANTAVWQTVSAIALLVTTSSGGGGLNVVTPWKGGQLQQVQYATEQGKDRLWLVHPNVPPQVLSRDPSTGNWSFMPVAFTNAPAEWGQNGPDGKPSWPSVVEVFQGRLWLAATPKSMSTVWASRPASATTPANPVQDFGLTDLVSGTQLVTPQSAIQAKLATKGALRWLHGKQSLLVGTDLGEGSITSQGGAITPLDFQFRQESGFGSAAVDARDVGDQVLYVSRDRRKVRAVSYVHEEQAWISRDVTFLGEHITAGVIAEAHFARDPNQTIALVLQDGTISFCAYDRVAQVTAWHRFAPRGQVLSAAVCETDTGSVLWMLVARTNGVLLEYLPMSEAGRVYLDASVTVTIPLGGLTQITGLTHLANQGVSIVCNGVVYPNVMVDGTGTVQLPAGLPVLYPVTVGLSYVGRICTLPPAGGPARAKRRLARIYLRLNDSAMPIVNNERDRTNLDRSALDVASGPARFSGDVGPFSCSYESRGQIEIVMDQPLRTEILGLFGSIDEGAV